MKVTCNTAGQTLILGVGNEFRGDDAVGLLAVRELRRRLGGRDDNHSDGARKESTERSDQWSDVVDGNEVRGGEAPGDRLVFVETSVGGLTLLDLVRGYQNLILIDAIRTEGGRPGDIYRLTGEDLSAGRSPWSTHHIGLKTVLDAGRACGCPLPGRVVIYAVEVADVHRWRLGCSRGIQRAVRVVVDRIINEELTALQPGSANRPEAANRPASASRPDGHHRPGGAG